MKNLDPAQIIALANLVSDKTLENARKSVGAGVATVVSPFSISCNGGNITVEGPEEYTPTVHLPLLDIMVIALHKAGFQRDNIITMIQDAATDALNADQKVGDKTKKDIDFVKSEVTALQVSLKSTLPKKLRNGKTKISVSWS